MLSRLVLGVLVVALLSCAAGGCGSTHATSVPTSAPAPTAPPAPSTTTTTVRPNPTTDIQTACRSFASFDSYVAAVGEDGPDAAGEVGGMVQDTQEALALGPSARWTRLEDSLRALEHYADSATWPETKKAAASPLFTTVAKQCRGLS